MATPAISPIRSRGAAALLDDYSAAPHHQHHQQQQQDDPPTPVRRRNRAKLTIRLIVTAIRMCVRFMTNIQERRYVICGGVAPWWAGSSIKYFGRFGKGLKVDPALEREVALNAAQQEERGRQQQHQQQQAASASSAGETGGESVAAAGAAAGDEEEEAQQQQPEVESALVQIQRAEERAERRKRKRVLTKEEQQQIRQLLAFDELPSPDGHGVSSRFEVMDADAALNGEVPLGDSAAAAADGSNAAFAGFGGSEKPKHRVHHISSNPADVREIAAMSVAEAAKTLQEIPETQDFVDYYPKALVRGLLSGVQESHAFICDLLRYRVVKRRRYREEMFGFPSEVVSVSSVAAKRKQSTVTVTAPDGSTTASSKLAPPSSPAEKELRFLPNEEEAVRLVIEAARNSFVFRDWPASIFEHVVEQSHMWRRNRNAVLPGDVVRASDGTVQRNVSMFNPVRRYQQGEVIIFQGEKSGSLQSCFFLLSGAVWELDKVSRKEKSLSLSKNARAIALHGVQPSVAAEVIQTLNAAHAAAVEQSKLVAAAAVKGANSNLKSQSLASLNKEGDPQTGRGGGGGGGGSSATPAAVTRRRRNSDAASHVSGSTTGFGGAEDVLGMSKALFPQDGSSSSALAAAFGGGGGGGSGGRKLAATAAGPGGGSSRPCVLRDCNAILRSDKQHAFIAASTCVVAQLPLADLEDCFCGSGLSGSDDSTCGASYLPRSAAEWLQLARSRRRLLQDRAARIPPMTSALLRRSPLLSELSDADAHSLAQHVKSCSFLRNATVVPRRFDEQSGGALELDGDDDGGAAATAAAAAGGDVTVAKQRADAMFASDVRCLRTLRESIVWVVHGCAAASSQRRSKATGGRWSLVRFFSYSSAKGDTFGEQAAFFQKPPVFDVVALEMLDVMYLPRQALLAKTMFDVSFRRSVNEGALGLRKSSALTSLTIRTLRAVHWLKRSIELELLSDQHLLDATHLAFQYKTFSPGELICASSDEVDAVFVLAAGTAVYGTGVGNQAQRTVPLWTLIGSEAAVFPALRWARPVVAMTVVEAWYATPAALCKALMTIPRGLRVLADDGVTYVSTRPKHRSGDHTLDGAIKRQAFFLEHVHEAELRANAHRERAAEKAERAQLFNTALNAWDDSAQTQRLRLLALRRVATDLFDTQDQVVRCVKRIKMVNNNKSKSSQQQKGALDGKEEDGEKQEQQQQQQQKNTLPATTSTEQQLQQDERHDVPSSTTTTAAAADVASRMLDDADAEDGGVSATMAIEVLKQLEKQHADSSDRALRAVEKIGPVDRKAMTRKLQEEEQNSKVVTENGVKTEFSPTHSPSRLHPFETVRTKAVSALGEIPAGAGVVKYKEKYGLSAPPTGLTDKIREHLDANEVQTAKQRARRNWRDIEEGSSKRAQMRQLLEQQQKLQAVLSPPRIPVQTSQPHGVRKTPIEEQEHFQQAVIEQQQRPSPSHSPKFDLSHRRTLVERYRPSVSPAGGFVPPLERLGLSNADRGDFGQDSFRVVAKCENPEDELAGVKAPPTPEVTARRRSGGLGVEEAAAVVETDQNQQITTPDKNDTADTADTSRNRIMTPSSAALAQRQSQQQQSQQQHRGAEEDYSAVVSKADDPASQPVPISLADLEKEAVPPAPTQAPPLVNSSVLLQHGASSGSSNQPKAADASVMNQRHRHDVDDFQAKLRQQRAAARARKEAQAAERAKLWKSREMHQQRVGSPQVQQFANLNVRSIMGVTTHVKIVSEQEKQRKARQQQKQKQQHSRTPPPAASAVDSAAAALLRIPGPRSTTPHEMLPHHFLSPQPRRTHLVAQDQQQRVLLHIERQRKERAELVQKSLEGRQGQQQQPYHPQLASGSGGGMYRFRRQSPQQQQQKQQLSPLPAVRPSVDVSHLESGLSRAARASPLSQGGSLVARARVLLTEMQNKHQQQQDDVANHQ